MSHRAGSGKKERLWPTPTTQEIEHPDAELTHTNRRKTKAGKSSHSLNLADSARLWPTPQANEDAAGTPRGKMQRMLGNHPKIRGETPEEWKQGSLNPAWVCWLMGYTLDYLDLDGWQNPELDGLPAEYLTEPKN